MFFKKKVIFFFQKRVFLTVSARQRRHLGRPATAPERAGTPPEFHPAGEEDQKV